VLYDYDEWVDTYWGHCVLSNGYWGFAKAHLVQAQSALDTADLEAAIQKLIDAGSDMWSGHEYMLFDQVYPYPRWDIFYVFEALKEDIDEISLPEEYELTLLKMITAFIDAPDDHRSAHRLLLDAYQASMYDKSFDMEYHKNWVTRFKQWR